MDELLAEFLTETGEGLDQLDVGLVRFEQEPNNAEILNTIFRLVHTVKGTCGFLGLNRLAKLAHAAETLMGQSRRRACHGGRRERHSRQHRPDQGDPGWIGTRWGRATGFRRRSHRPAADPRLGRVRPYPSSGRHGLG
ncbi:MAG TPA: Hpt domain-containing protein [Methyloceanibacter sp.]|nr:Hpt domain-containing protein [Methyloceanibacter sp.]